MNTELNNPSLARNTEIKNVSRREVKMRWKTQVTINGVPITSEKLKEVIASSSAFDDIVARTLSRVSA